MKVVYRPVNPRIVGTNFIIDKAYEVESVSHSIPDENGLSDRKYYRIKDERGVTTIYDSKYFIDLDKCREEKLDKILNYETKAMDTIKLELTSEQAELLKELLSLDLENIGYNRYEIEILNEIYKKI